MRAYYYIYTSTQANDYGSLVTIDSSIGIPKEEFNRMSKRVRSVMNVDAIGSDILNDPIWLLVKESKFSLWGIACNSKLLTDNAEYCHDHTGRETRSFIGMVIDNMSGEIRLPFEISFFRKVYQMIVVPMYQRKTEKLNIQCGIEISGRTITPCYSTSSRLNYDQNICRSFSSNSSDTFFEYLVSDALACSEPISIANNIKTLVQVTNTRLYPFTNAMLLGQHEPTVDNPVTHICEKCGKEVKHVTNYICDKCKAPVIGTKYNSLVEPLPGYNYCSKCGARVDFLIEERICENCYRAERRRKIRVRLISALFLICLIALGILHYCGISLKSIKNHLWAPNQIKVDDNPMNSPSSNTKKNTVIYVIEPDSNRVIQEKENKVNVIEVTNKK